MNVIRGLWVDPDHMYLWEGHFLLIEKRLGYRITPLKVFDCAEILSKARGKALVVMHPGTLAWARRPHALVASTVKSLQEKYPGIRVILHTEARWNIPGVDILSYQENPYDFFKRLRSEILGRP